MLKRLRSFSLCVAALGLVQAQAPAPKKVAIKCARLMDGKGDAPLLNAVVLVEGARIQAVGSGLSIPEGAEVVDLGDATLMPGLIDCHTHLLQDYRSLPDWDDLNMVDTVSRLSPAERALLGAFNGREMLESGFTTVRDLGNSGVNGDVALRDAIAKGWVAGPRILAATRALSALGGQFPRLAKASQDLVAQEYVEVSTPEEARRAVRQALADGADCIKVIVDTWPRVVGLEEMKVVVEEAHRVKRKVAAHAVTQLALDVAIAAGVDSIEHAYQAQESHLREMAKRGIVLVPTFVLLEDFLACAPSAEERKRMEAQLAGYEASAAKLLNSARRLGVKLAAGSDAYYRIPGKTRGQAALGMLQAYHKAGIPTPEILRMATSQAAELLGWQERIGTLEAGKLADLVAVKGDLLKDFEALGRVALVMKEGKVVWH